MKKLLIVLLLFSVSVSAEDIEGDTNHDGVLSGEEQYLLNNPPSNTTREEVQAAVRYNKAKLEAAQTEADMSAHQQYNNAPTSDIAGALIESKRYRSSTPTVRLQTNCQQIFDRVVCQ